MGGVKVNEEIPQAKHVPEFAEEVLQDIARVLARHNCFLTPGHGVFYLGRILTSLPPQGTAIATVRSINPGMIEWAPADVTKVPKGATH
jgi:hypothetical protein